MISNGKEILKPSAHTSRLLLSLTRHLELLNETELY